MHHSHRLGGNSNLDIHTRLDGNLGDLLDNAGWSVQVNHSLVDSELKVVVGLRTLTVWRLSSVDSQNLGWHSDRSLLQQVVFVGVSNDVARHVLKLLDLGGHQGDSDLEDGLLLLLVFLLGGHYG